MVGQLRCYLENNKKFPKEQHGFRKNHSTSTLLNILVDDLSINNQLGKTSGLISMKLSSALDLFDKDVLFKN